jgi:hypothetical protein
MLIYVFYPISSSGVVQFVIRDAQHQSIDPLILSLVEAASNIILFERIDGRHICIGQVEVERIKVGLDP